MEEDMHHGSLCWPIIAAGNFHTLISAFSHNAAVLRKWSQHGEDSTMCDMWSPTSTWSLMYTVPMFLHGVLGFLFVLFSMILEADSNRSHFYDILMACCLLLSCFRFICMWRLSVIGSRIYTIVQTFLASAVNQMLFITFLLLFAFIVALMVLSRFHTVALFLASYRGFLFGDGDGFNGLGMDVPHKEVGPFAIE